MALHRKHILSGFLGLVVTGSFAAGVFEPELKAQGSLPDTIFSLRPEGGKELDPARTYNKVLDILNEKYVGDNLPSARKLTYTAIRGLLNAADDPYTRFLDPDEFRQLKEENDGEFDGIGATLEPQPTKEGYIKVLRPVPGGPAETAGVKRGDMITKIDGKPTTGLDVDEAVKLIRGKAGTIVKLSIKRSGQAALVEKAITRRPVELPILEYRMLEGGVGYISLLQFNEVSDRKIELAVRDLEAKGMKALVFDLRGNPGGLLTSAIDISSRFVKPGSDVVWIEEAQESDRKKTNGRVRYLGERWPFTILVNRTSASASEIVAGAVKDNKTGTVIGATTFGKGLVQTLMPLDDGSAVLITTAKYLTPSRGDINRSKTQRGGVVPDIEVEVTEGQFLKGEDPQLKKALEHLHQKIGYTKTGKNTTGAPKNP